MKKTISGFTIVELLIVIVVIAILAAISIVAYTGIQRRARVATVQSDLRQMHQLLGIYNLDEGSYPTTGTQIVASGIRKAISMSTNNRVVYCGDSSGYVLIMSAGGTSSGGGTADPTTSGQFKIGSETAMTEVTPPIAWSASPLCATTAYPNQGWNNTW